MVIEVRYQSRGGNTKAVAEFIAKSFNVQAYSIDKPIEKNVDVLFLGGGVYGWAMDKSLKEFINKLPTKNIGQIIAFSTSGATNSTINQIRQLATKKGMVVNKKDLLVKMILHGHSMLRLKGGNLNKKHEKVIEEFLVNIKGGLL